MASNENENKHLKELGKSSYKVAEGDSDIRGWAVKNVDGRLVGVVDDLVIDSEAEKVKYLVVDLSTNELQLRDRKVILPIDLARLDVAFKNVIYPAPMANELAAIPTHEKGRFFYQTEGLISTAFAPYYHRNQDQSRTESTRETPASPPPVIPHDPRISSDQPAGFAPQQHPSTEAHRSEARDIQDTATTHEGYDTTRDNMRDREDTTRLTDRGERPQAVVGVFDHTFQAQAAVEYLVKQGFGRESIEIMLRDADDYDTSRKGEQHSSISEFFSSLFRDDDTAKDYSDAATTCSVVTLHTDSLRNAEKAAEIMDMHGAVNVEDRYPRQGRADHTDVARTKRYQSLIIERPDEGRVRGLR